MTAHFPVVDSALKADLTYATSLCFAALDIPLRWAESPFFTAMLVAFAKCYKHGLVKKLDGRQRIAANQQDLAKSIGVDVDAELVKSKHPITALAFDGWSNVNGVHVQNVLAHCSSATFFLKSDVSPSGRATADVLFGFLEEVTNRLIEKKVVVAGIVADNAAVNGDVAKHFKAKFPRILPIPCASHTLQLCMSIDGKGFAS